jgi:2-dehydropantoate 2-reductase
VDTIIVATKTTVQTELPRLLAPLLHARTTVLTLQNGLGADEALAAACGAERVVGGLCFVCVNRTGPGELHCLEPGSVALAEFAGPAGPRVQAIADAFRAAGVVCSVHDRLIDVRWKKLVWNIPFNGLAIAAGGIATDRILADPALETEVRALMTEVIAAARRLGVDIPMSFIERQIAHTRPMGAYRPSSLIDFLEGRPIELEAIWGEPLRRAQAVGVPMPHLAQLYATLRRVTVPSVP